MIIHDLENDMRNNSCFKCIVNPLSHDKLHGPRVILIGDAGHSVTSTLGQGCNAALESCTVFDEVRVHAVGIHLAPPPLRLLIQPDLPPASRSWRAAEVILTERRPSSPRQGSVRSTPSKRSTTSLPSPGAPRLPEMPRCCIGVYWEE